MYYIAKDWRGIHLYKGVPRLLEHLPSFPPTFTGHELFMPENYPISIRLKSGEFKEALVFYTIFEKR